jgi:copper chaperone NosL
MAISEKRYAAEIITKDETVLKFDDIGCMLRYQRTKGDAANTAAIYVADSETKRWLKADDAFFIRSTMVKTPMGSGITAFVSADKAGPGVLRFSDLQEK